MKPRVLLECSRNLRETTRDVCRNFTPISQQSAMCHLCFLSSLWIFIFAFLTFSFSLSVRYLHIYHLLFMFYSYLLHFSILTAPIIESRYLLERVTKNWLSSIRTAFVCVDWLSFIGYKLQYMSLALVTCNTSMRKKNSTTSI